MSIPIRPHAAKFLNDHIVPRLDDRQLQKLVSTARREQRRRYLAAEALKERVGGAMQGMANVMAGVTWALLCRASLRASKGHLPVGGKRAASGEMWLPRELLTAVRHQVKERGWHPITSLNWETVRANYSAELLAARRPPVSDSILGPDLHVAKFVIPFAGQAVSREIAVDKAFDFSDVRAKS